MKQVHLTFALLLIGCGGDSFGSDEREATSDGGGLVESGGEPAMQVARGGGAGGAGGSAPLIGGSGGVAGLDGSSAHGGAAGSPDSGAAGSPDSGAGVGGVGGVGGVDSGAGDIDAGGPGGAGGSTPACTTGETRCSGAQPEVCASGDWFASGAACSGEMAVCLNGRCVECAPSTEQCLNPAQPGVCDATGFWATNGDACTGTTPHCLDNECFDCNPDDVRTAGYCGDCGGGIPCCVSSTGLFPGGADKCGCWNPTYGCEPSNYSP